MQIYDFVESELNYFRQECNFSDEELEYFNLRAKHYSNQQKMSVKVIVRLLNNYRDDGIIQVP